MTGQNTAQHNQIRNENTHTHTQINRQTDKEENPKNKRRYQE